jgi:hypothetical protein
MWEKMRNIYTKDILLGIIGILIIIMSIFPKPVYVHIPYSVYNTEWDGLSEFYKFTNTYGSSHVITSPHNFNDYENGTIFIVSPTKPLSKSEIDRIKDYLLNGYDLILVDDDGSASNAILRHFGVNKEIAGDFAQDIFYEKNCSFPEVNYNIGEFRGTVITSVPSYIVNPSEYGVARTSKARTSKITKKEMVDVEYINNSKLIIVSDPDIFTNSLKDYNIEFWNILISTLSNSDNFYFDELHHSNNAIYFRKDEKN